MASWGLAINAEAFSDFLEVPQFSKIFRLKSFDNTHEATQTSISDHLLWKEIVLKREKVYKYFVHDCK